MTLTEHLTELYWGLNEYSIDDQRRMQAVIHEISQIIRGWAPDEGLARITHLAITGVADRLLEQAMESKS